MLFSEHATRAIWLLSQHGSRKFFLFFRFSERPSCPPSSCFRNEFLRGSVLVRKGTVGHMGSISVFERRALLGLQYHTFPLLLNITIGVMASREERISYSATKDITSPFPKTSPSSP